VAWADFYGCRAANGQTRFKIGRDGTRTETITKYRDHLLSRPELIAALPELRSKDLACWCAWTIFLNRTPRASGCGP